MTNHKPTRTDNNKPSQSTPIRKGKLSPEVIKKTAEELTRLQVVEAPKIEPVEAWDYEIYSAYVKAHCKMHDTYETTGDELKKMFPQNKDISDIVRNLKRSHDISWRRVENGRNDTYVFFVEPTREELIVMLTSAETKVIELEKVVSKVRSMWSALNECERQKISQKKLYEEQMTRLTEENTKLKSDLFYSQRSNNILFRFAIWAVITIIFKSVAL